ncbi:MAG: ABC transporter ATP-binding protein [Flavobacteriaceae bacterium]|nr:ABC transporter ATP-binding protein [Flavobacteriaceae bacterium]MCY4216820.1 ABC transporter ATP-binding protein [Flavobacteriaceae bacterium]
MHYTSKSSVLLKLNALSKNYGRIKAVDSLSMQIEKGKVYGLLGPNGSGKSTTLGMILNTINPSSGYYQWYGGDMPFKEARKKIGAIIERPNFYPYLSAIRNLHLVCKIKECSTNRIEEVLKYVDLWDRRSSKFRTFSLGMKQRLALASSLINQPEMLILDEPTNGLDPAGIHKVRALITKIASQGTTILLASHLLDEVEKVCTDVVIIKNGIKYFEGAVEDLSKNHGHIEIISDDIDALMKILSSHKAAKKIEMRDDKLILHLQQDLPLNQLTKELSQHSIFVSHLVKKTPTLEERFLEITQNSPNDSVDSN